MSGQSIMRNHSPHGYTSDITQVRSGDEQPDTKATLLFFDGSHQSTTRRQHVRIEHGGH